MSYCKCITLASGERGGSAGTSDWLLGLLLAGHVAHQVADTLAVGKLIVVPGEVVTHKKGQYASVGQKTWGYQSNLC